MHAYAVIMLRSPVFVHVSMYVGVGHLGVWGELVNHKIALTHRPSSQGWAPECPIDCLFVLCGCGGFLSFLPLRLPKLCGVLYTCTFMYMYP